MRCFQLDTSSMTSSLTKALIKEGNPYLNKARYRNYYLWLLTQSYSAIPKNLRREPRVTFVWYPKERASHLREHNFKHSFQYSLNPFCSCEKGEVEISSHYLLHCSNYLGERLALLSTIKNID